MSEKKVVAANVENIIDGLKKNPSTRFSKSDFQTLVWGIMADKSFKVKKYALRNDALVEEDSDVTGGLYKFLDKLLKHAGMTDSNERAEIIDSFEYGARDIEWVADAVDEAMSIYTECGKNLKLFRDKIIQLTIKKMVRTGKYAGTITYRKVVVNRALALEKKAGKKNA